MTNDTKDYTVKEVESITKQDLNKTIRNNIIFTIAGLILAGVAFGIGDEIFDSTSIQNIVAFGCVGISCGSVRALKSNLKLKSQLEGKQKVKGKK